MVVLVPAGVLAQSQYSSMIRGYVFDEYKEPLAFATVLLLESGVPVNASASDLNGYYQFDKLHPGEYAIVVRYLGWKDSVASLRLPPDHILQLKDIILPLTDAIICCDFHLPKIPLLDPWQPETQYVLRREQIDHLPGR